MLKIDLIRDGKPLRLRVTPEREPRTGRGQVGVVLREPWMRAPLPEIAGAGARFTVRVAGDLVNLLVKVVTGRMAADLAGPIGIAQMVGESARVGFFNLLFLAALLNVNLGLLNLFPIPVLDGGWLVLLALEALRRRPLDPDQEALLRLAGAVIILLIVLFATYSDLMRLGSMQPGSP